MKKKEFVKICPKCGNTDIKIPHAGLDLRMTIKDECVACGFIGNFPEVEVEKIKELQKKLKK